MSEIEDGLDLIRAQVCGLWPHWKPNRATLQLFTRYLGDLDLDLVAAVVDSMAVDEAYKPWEAPSPAQIRARVLNAAAPLLLPDADAALAEVATQIRRTGRYNHPTWSHPAIGVTVDAMGGWQQACDSENPEAFRAHFLRLYAPMARRERAQSAIPTQAREILEQARLDATAGALGPGADDAGDHPHAARPGHPDRRLRPAP